MRILLACLLAASLLSLACQAARRDAEPVGPTPVAAEVVDPRLPRLAGILRAEDRREVDDALRAGLKDSDVEVRASAVRALGEIGSPGARGDLLDAMRDPEPRVRAVASVALSQTGSSGAVEALVELARDEAVEVRATVAYALGQLRAPEGMATVLGLLEDAEPVVQAQAALAAWRFEDAAPAISSLVARSESKDTLVREAATYALGRLGAAGIAPAGSGPNPRSLSQVERSRVRQRLLALVGDPTAEIRMQVARGLHTPESPEELSTLATLARDPVRGVRVNAVRSLCFPGAPFDPHVRKALNDRDDLVKWTVIDGLSRLRGESVGNALLSGIAKESRSWLRETAVGSLAQSNPEVFAAALPQLAKDTDPRVRAAAARGLLLRTETNVFDVARAALSDADPAVQAAAVGTLQGDSGKLSEILAGPITSTDLGVRAAVARAAGQRIAKSQAGTPEREDAVSILERLWDGTGADPIPWVRREVLAAAARAGRDPLARGLLDRGVADGDRRVRVAAIEAVRTVWGEDLSRRAGPASDLPLEHYVKVLRWAESPRAALVTVEREGFEPGRFTVRLDTKQAPLASWNFAQLAEKLFYDGLTVHRVVPNFVVQDGDPRGDGEGDPGYAIRDEFNRIRFDAGVLGMASEGKDTAGSQWFITLSRQPHLDGRYTAFGRVVQNLEGVVGFIHPRDRVVSIRTYKGSGVEPLP